MMKRYIKAVFVLMGWAVVFMVILTIGAPIVSQFTRSDGVVPFESILVCVVTFYAIVTPLIYASFTILAPLVYMTMEVFSKDGH